MPHAQGRVALRGYEDVTRTFGISLSATYANSRSLIGSLDWEVFLRRHRAGLRKLFPATPMRAAPGSWQEADGRTIPIAR